jgi:hypothetical protein
MNPIPIISRTRSTTYIGAAVTEDEKETAHRLVTYMRDARNLRLSYRDIFLTGLREIDKALTPKPQDVMNRPFTGLE